MVYGLFTPSHESHVRTAPPLVRQLRSRVPSGERSRFVARVIASDLKKKSSALEDAARRANKLANVSREMKDWEALNGYED